MVDRFIRDIREYSTRHLGDGLVEFKFPRIAFYNAIHETLEILFSLAHYPSSSLSSDIIIEHKSASFARIYASGRQSRIIYTLYAHITIGRACDMAINLIEKINKKNHSDLIARLLTEPLNANTTRANG
jgi:hypothetical protein